MSNTTTVTQQNTLDQLSIQVVAALASGIALLIAVVIQLLYRSTTRHSRLTTAKVRLRFDVNYLMSKNSDLHDALVADALDAQKKRDAIAREPPYREKRVVPTVSQLAADGRSARAECKNMLAELRSALGSSFGKTANMTMRAALYYMEGALNPADVARFLYVYEAILFGHHRADGTLGDVTHDDVKFMTTYFNVIMKQMS